MNDEKTEKMFSPDATQKMNNSYGSNDNSTLSIFDQNKRHTNTHDNTGNKYRCMGCMELCDKKDEFCKNCGYIRYTEPELPLYIVPGTILKDKYIVGKTLGNGGFGVTYIGWDLVLKRKIAIKEYLPSEFATRSWGQRKLTVFGGEKSQQFEDGKKKFVEEAKRLAKFQNENGIVNIYDSFEENGTAYIVMEYLDGETLTEYLDREGQIPYQQAIEMLVPIIDSLNTIHSAGIIHRDIAPDNIILTEDGRIKLIDFGAARYATTSHSRSLTVIVKAGYSPEEQYRSRGDQGPHTDVYALGAVLYKMITGQTPPDAFCRKSSYEGKGQDLLIPINKFVKDVPKSVETAIYNAMNVRIEDRTPDMVNLMGELMSDDVKRRNGKIKKIDVLSWPLWAKILAPTAISFVLILSVLLGVGVIGPRSKLRLGVNIPDGMTLIPDVVSYDLKEADEELKKKELNHLIGEKIEDERIKENLILLQNPDAGNITGIGTFIKLSISAGAPKEFVTNVVGFTKELAKKELEALGFKVEFKEDYSEDVAPGAVISQSVKEGEEFEKGGVIELIISKGNKDIDTTKEVNIPNITGMPIENAKALLKKLNLYIAISESVYSDTIPKDQIISQTPEEGKGHQGDTVNVKISLGTKQNFVPDVIYRTESEAMAMLEAKGLIVKVVREENKEVAAGTVFKQSIKAGTQAQANTVITITVSKGYIVKVPNVVNEKMKDAQLKLSSAGLSSTVSYENSDTVAKDKVISQSVKAGSKVQQGTAVHLVVSAGKEELPQQEVVLASIYIANKPVKLSYAVGDSFDKTGLKVMANYSDGSQKDVTSKCTVSGFSSSSAGTKTVKVIYTEGRAERSASFTVTVKENTYRVTVSRGSGISSVSGAGNYSAGDRVTVRATVSSGYEFNRWTSNNTGLVSNSTSANYTFTMPRGNVTLTASASKKAVPLIESGKCGTNANYTLDVNGLLTISGTGEMKNCAYFAEEHPAWYSNHAKIKKVVIEKGITTIGDSAFEGCENLTSVIIPDGVKFIGIGAMQNCTALKNITIPSSVININTYAFEGCSSLQSITIPNSVKYIGTNAFSSCSNLTYVKLSNNLIEIDHFAFSRCSKLKSITIPYGITTLKESVFEGCSSLQSVSLPSSIKIIESDVFENCTSLKSITIPSGVTEIGMDVFKGCSSLTSIKVSPQSSTFCEIDGILFSKNQKTIARFPTGRKGSYTIPSYVNTIGKYAFDSCVGLQNVIIPQSVKTIESGAFNDCTGIKSIRIPLSVVTIKRMAFTGWKADQTIYLVGRTGHQPLWDDGWDMLCDADIYWNA